MFWEDYYIEHPTDAKRTKDGNVVFSTGDPLIDKWEQELAMGLIPDLTEGLSPEARAKERAALAKLQGRVEKEQKAKIEIGDGFSEEYIKY